MWTWTVSILPHFFCFRGDSKLSFETDSDTRIAVSSQKKKKKKKNSLNNLVFKRTFKNFTQVLNIYISKNDRICG